LRTDGYIEAFGDARHYGNPAAEHLRAIGVIVVPKT